jgi:hypothetical protein
MTTPKTSIRFLIASLIVCSAFAASVISAKAQVERAPGPINKSRPLQSTSRTAGHIDTLNLLIRRESGERIASRTIEDSDSDGTLSDIEGAFDFGTLPAGAYVLTLSLQEQVPSTDSKLEIARVNITGAAGGDVDKEWDFKNGKASDVGTAQKQTSKLGTLTGEITGLSDKAASTNKLDERIDKAASQLNGRTDAGNQTGIAFKANGTTKIGGKITLPTGSVIIKNIGKNN